VQRHNTVSPLVRRRIRGVKELRNRLGITTREVENLSREIAEKSNNMEFYISNAWLTQIENGESVPSIFKLFSLSVIFRIKFSHLLLLFGVDLEKSTQFQRELNLPNTHLLEFEPSNPRKAITFPVRFDSNFSLEKTSLVSRMVEVWGEVPIHLIEMLSVRNCQYGYIGIDDYTMYPLLRPGSFVQIQQEVGHAIPENWRNEFDRPIFFIELRDAYVCGWCELKESQLTLIPHPLSRCSTRRFAYPDEAEIVGQVSAVAMRLISTQQDRHPESLR
jgi:transcriptional regulator with XRE-family HTH domain